MTERLKSIRFLSCIVMMGFFILQVNSQDITKPEPPPIDIVLTAGKSSQEKMQVEIKLKVTPNDDMHADISCLLPQETELVRETGLLLHPQQDRHGHNRQKKFEHHYSVGLWRGPLEKGIAKEFIFRIAVHDKGRYELIAIVDALTKWGTKEEKVIIDFE